MDNIEINIEETNFCNIIQYDDSNYTVNLQDFSPEFCVEVNESIAPHKHPISDIIGLQQDLDDINDSLQFLSDNKADLVDGKVPSSQLPSYLDDVLEFPTLADFPTTGQSGIIYLALDTNQTYRWAGTTYVVIGSSLALGETSSTAYRGDRGKIAYDHSQTIGNPHGTTKGDIGLGNVDNTSDLNKPISTATQTALDTKIGLTSLSSIAPIRYNNTTGAFSANTANNLQDGFLTSADWNIFFGKQDAITLTTTGNSGASTFVSNTLNIPTYTLAGLGGVPTSRTITINGTTQDLSANRTFNVGTVTSVSANSPLSSTGGNTPTISIQQASGSQSGFLSSTDWNTFNNKQNALTNPITGTSSSGRVAFFNGTTTQTGDSNFFWDNTNKRLGLGTTSPIGKLHLDLPSGAFGSSNSYNVLSYGNSNIFRSYMDGNWNYINEVIQNGTNQSGYIIVTNGTERMRITSGGNVGIGTSVTNGRLHVTSFNGTVSVIEDASNISNITLVSFVANTNLIGSITRVGTTNAVAYNTTSDYRLKEDLKEIKGLEKLSKIKVYDFKWKDNDHRMDGVLAHELQEVIPYAVTGEKDGEQMQSVDYSKLVPVLVKAIQEQQKEIEMLKNLINK